MLRLATLVLLFITRIRFPPGTPFNHVICQRYGRPAVDRYRAYEKIELKQLTLQADIKFLISCKQNDTIPNFIHFKTYNRKFRSTKLYKNSSALKPIFSIEWCPCIMSLRCAELMSLTTRVGSSSTPASLTLAFMS